MSLHLEWQVSILEMHCGCSSFMATSSSTDRSPSPTHSQRDAGQASDSSFCRFEAFCHTASKKKNCQSMRNKKIDSKKAVTRRGRRRANSGLTDRLKASGVKNKRHSFANSSFQWGWMLPEIRLEWDTQYFSKNENEWIDKGKTFLSFNAVSVEKHFNYGVIRTVPL